MSTQIATGTTNIQKDSIVAVTAPKKLLFFVIYYKDSEGSFGRVAETQMRQIKTSSEWTAGRDELFTQVVRTESDFYQTWEALYQKASKGGFQVQHGFITSHATKGDGAHSGLEFYPEPDHREDATATRDELMKLTRLPWAKGGRLEFNGCNTGLSGARRSWSVAEIMAKSQGARTTGQLGYSYFSLSKSKYVEITPTAKDVYLRAFHRRKNGLLGNGNAMPEKEFTP